MTKVRVTQLGARSKHYLDSRCLQGIRNIIPFVISSSDLLYQGKSRLNFFLSSRCNYCQESLLLHFAGQPCGTFEDDNLEADDDEEISEFNKIKKCAVCAFQAPSKEHLVQHFIQVLILSSKLNGFLFFFLWSNFKCLLSGAWWNTWRWQQVPQMWLLCVCFVSIYKQKFKKSACGTFDIRTWRIWTIRAFKRQRAGGCKFILFFIWTCWNFLGYIGSSEWAVIKVIHSLCSSAWSNLSIWPVSFKI
jgi:hypothetical protein